MKNEHAAVAALCRERLEETTLARIDGAVGRIAAAKERGGAGLTHHCERYDHPARYAMPDDSKARTSPPRISSSTTLAGMTCSSRTRPCCSSIWPTRARSRRLALMPANATSVPTGSSITLPSNSMPSRLHRRCCTQSLSDCPAARDASQQATSVAGER